MSFTNPGQEFARLHGQVTGPDDLVSYAAYLREQAGLTTDPPIDLQRIYAHFDIPLPKRRPLHDIQGILANPRTGVILINSDDAPARQRFTEAHELMELLFSCLNAAGGSTARRQAGPFKIEAKERLCDAGAAELLMPRDSFGAQVRLMGVSFQSARQLARLYQVSITAALVQMIRCGPGCHCVVLWRMKNKPSESRQLPTIGQLTLMGMPVCTAAIPKLRVEWTISSPGSPYIPRDKSIPESSSVFQAWDCGKFTQGRDHLNLGSIIGSFGCESQPFEIEGDRYVLSLLHMPGDLQCRLGRP